MPAVVGFRGLQICKYICKCICKYKIYLYLKCVWLIWKYIYRVVDGWLKGAAKYIVIGNTYTKKTLTKPKPRRHAPKPRPRPQTQSCRGQCHHNHKELMNTSMIIGHWPKKSSKSRWMHSFSPEKKWKRMVGNNFQPFELKTIFSVVSSALKKYWWDFLDATSRQRRNDLVEPRAEQQSEISCAQMFTHKLTA